MNRPVKWVAELAHVREVSILGLADLAYWRDRLRQADLVPAERAGHAQILIVAGHARFAGVGFRELSFSALLSTAGAATRQDRAYLVHAVNSCWAFAFCERTFFSTPYYHGQVRVGGSFPASIEFVKDGKVLFGAQMPAGTSPEDRRPSCCREDGWEGPVFLPEPRERRIPPGKLFFARIKGYAMTYPFLQPNDSLEIRPSAGSPVLQALLESHFVPTEVDTSRRCRACEIKNLQAVRNVGGVEPCVSCRTSLMQRIPRYASGSIFSPAGAGSLMRVVGRVPNERFVAD